MRKRSWIPYACILVVSLLVLGTPGHGAADQYYEYFATTEYCDTMNTTAFWDTSSGELNLHTFEPTLAGSFDTLEIAFGVAISGDYAYVAGWNSGLLVLDISNPADPRLAGSYSGFGTAWSVAVSGNFAYVLDRDTQLLVLNISDPANPVFAGSCSVPEHARGIAVSGNYAYVAAKDSGLFVVNIFVPAYPTLAGSCQTQSTVKGVAISGDYAYVASSDSGLQVIDIRNPASPTHVASFDTPGYAEAVAISGDYAYVADAGPGLQVIDITNPASPAYGGGCTTPGYACHIAISGDYAYVADGFSGLMVVDIRAPTSPGLVGNYDTPGDGYGLALSGDYAYVADGNSGLQVIKIAEPVLPPEPAGGCSTPGWASDVAISGDYAYVAGIPVLQIMSINDPTTPTFEGSTTSGSAYGVAISGDHAYVAHGDRGLVVFDVSNPTSQDSVGSCATPDYALGVAISGDYAYIAAGVSGLQVIDISDPTTPTLEGTCDTPEYALDVAVSGDYAYVADDLSGLHIINIGSPASLEITGSCDTPGDANDVVISGDFAYVADYYSGLQIIDISDSTNPTLEVSYDTPGCAFGVAISGDYAYVADADYGLQVVDVRDPANPIFAGWYDTPGLAYDVAISGDYAYVADGASGLQVLQVFGRRFRRQDNMAQSLLIDTSGREIFDAYMQTSQVDSILWELSADGGSNWQEPDRDGGVSSFTSPGSDLLWRATLQYQATEPEVNPTCTMLQIGWSYDCPWIDTISDVPDDQGRHVLISWGRCYSDRLGSSTPATEYAIFAREEKVTAPPASRAVPNGKKAALRRLTESNRPQAVYPPGEWYFVKTVPACCEDLYATVVPTLLDSTESEGIQYSVFFVRAGTGIPSVYYDSDPDSGYSVDNLAPAPPPNLRMASAVEVAWDDSEAEDFDYFTVYGSSGPDLDSTATLVGCTAGTSMDVTDDQHNHYHVTATDFSGNEGDPSSVENTYSGVRLAREVPTAYALKPNRPNPFDTETVIRFDLPERGVVRLEVFDISGRQVQVLTEGEYPAGRHSVTWAGADAAGRAVGPGIYFIRIDAGTFSQTSKMLLMR